MKGLFRVFVFYVFPLMLNSFVLRASDSLDLFADLETFDPSVFSAPDFPEPREPVPVSVPEECCECEPEERLSADPALEDPAPDFTPPPETELQKNPALEMTPSADGNPVSAPALFPAPSFQISEETISHNRLIEQSAPTLARQSLNKKKQREIRSYEAARAQLMDDVQAAWKTPLAQNEKQPGETERRAPPEAERRAAGLRRKLESLRLSSISFHGTDVQQAILELSAVCRRLDPEQKGVNLVVYGTGSAVLPPVTFSGSDLSAFEALEIITQMSGMKFEIGPNLVVLTPVNYEPPQQMISAEFEIIPSVGAGMAARAEFGAGGLLDVRSFFSTVPFPPGSGAQYNPEFHLLLVHNVPKHIGRIAELLDRFTRRAVEERSRQVEIETKFIEVSQSALDELGFEWTLGTPGDYVTSDTWTLPGGQKLFTDTLRTGQAAFSSDVRPAGRAGSFNTYAAPLNHSEHLADTAGELLVRKIKGGLRADLVIRALERTAGADLLSAPKILTRSGETASIHVGEIHWFPAAFDVALERYSQPALVPLDYQEERTGVMLEVTPELDPETGTINLNLSPEIRELAGFTEQHVGTIWPEFGKEDVTIYRDAPGAVGPYSDKIVNFLTAREQNRTVNADRLIARRPVFKTRKVTTTVTIEDGTTIAMGGLIKEQMETFRDSVPVLGKIPLLGRLFRSEGKRNVKRNLLIFVTAHQVNASGGRSTVP